METSLLHPASPMDCLDRRQGRAAACTRALALVACLPLLAACGQSSGSSFQADFAGSPRTGDAPLAVQFTDLSPGEATSWAWEFGDGGNSTLADPEHVYQDPGSYSVVLTAGGPDGQTGRLERSGYVEVTDPTQVSSFGASTPGGQGGSLLHVTSLASAGPGSLREALEASGPRTVLFDVAGVIDLELARIRVLEPFLTVEGRSGPAPGITLIRGGLSIRTHDVRIEHLRVRPGDAGQLPGSGWEPDGIGVWGPDARDVLVENCSISWAVDENVSVSSFDPPNDTPRRVTFRNCFITEALRASTHVDGNHSRGALIRGQEVAIEGCLFAHDSRRNPVFRDGATGIIVNNLIYDPESAAIHLADARASVVGNVLIHGLDTKDGLPLLKEQGAAYLDDNLAFDSAGDPVEIFDPVSIELLARPPFWRGPEYIPLPASQVETSVLLSAGAWPDQRDPIDQRIVQQFLARMGRVIDSQDDVGGYPP